MAYVLALYEIYCTYPEYELFEIIGQKYPKIAKVHPHPVGYRQPIQYKMLKESITSWMNLK